MGREVRRVAIDFNWPLKKTWEGFLNPHYAKCPDCESGYSKAYRLIQEHTNRLMWDRQGMSNPDYATITTFLAGRAPSAPLGHDSCDAWSAIKKLGELAGLPEGWDTCQTCKGEGIHPDNKAAYDAWKPTNPPAGEGWQMWETTSEGSPISPVCETPEMLARWLVDNRASSFGSDTATYDQWLRMIKAGWAPSAVMGPDGLQSGVAALAAPAESSERGSL